MSVLRTPGLAHSGGGFFVSCPEVDGVHGRFLWFMSFLVYIYPLDVDRVNQSLGVFTSSTLT
jgi:hypothetical protein